MLSVCCDPLRCPVPLSLPPCHVLPGDRTVLWAASEGVSAGGSASLGPQPQELKVRGLGGPPPPVLPLSLTGVTRVTSELCWRVLQPCPGPGTPRGAPGPSVHTASTSSRGLRPHSVEKPVLQCPGEGAGQSRVLPDGQLLRAGSPATPPHSVFLHVPVVVGP